MKTKFELDPDFDPNVFQPPFGSGDKSVDRKAPPPRTIYPNLEDFTQIDAEQFYSPEYMQREWLQVWTKTWVCAGREMDIAQTGAYFKFDLVQESFIISRGSDQKIRAFYNACQHRARQLVDDDFGRRLQFSCPFHGWRYEAQNFLFIWALKTVSISVVKPARSENMSRQITPG